MKAKGRLKRSFAWLLVLTLAFTMSFGNAVFATDGGSGEQQTGNSASSVVDDSSQPADTEEDTVEAAEVGPGSEAQSGSTTETTKVAEIEGNQYETLDEAISSAESGDTVKLLDNVDYSTAKCFDIEKELTLDLSGKAITAVSNGSCSDGGATHFIRVKNGGDLTITDSSADKTGCITATYGANSQLMVVEVMTGGKFTFNGGKVQNAASTNYGSSTVYIRDGGTFILDGGTVAAVKPTANKRAYAVWNVGTMKMISGLIISNDSSTAAVTQNAAKSESETEIALEISGGEIDSANNGFISVSQGKALPVISGGEFSGALNVKWLADGTYGINGDTGSTAGTVAPETFNACINQKLFYTGESGADDAVKVLTKGDALTLKKTPGEVKTTDSFSSGKFTVVLENDAEFNPAAISVNAGYTVEATAVNNTTTEYNVVVDKEKAQARIGDVYYTTLANANVNAKNGETITVIKDVTGLTSTINISKELTIDLNGHLIQGKRAVGSLYPNGPIIKGYSVDTKLTVIDSSEEKSGKIENTANSGSAVFADKGSVVIKGGAFVGKDASVIANSNAILSVEGGYFLNKIDEDYLAEGKALVESDKSGYTYMVSDKKVATEGEAELKPAVGEVKGNVSDEIDESVKAVVKEAAENVKADDKALDAAVRTQVNNGNVDTVKQEDAEKKLCNEVTVNEGDAVTVYTQAYLDVKVTDYKAASSENEAPTYVMDIKPMYQLIASTAETANDINIDGKDGKKNAVALGEPQPLEVNTAVEVTVPLPEGFMTGEKEQITVKHTKDDGTVYYYPADVKDGIAVFTNPHGFSTFELMVNSDNAAANLLEVKGAELSPKFDKDVFEYTVNVEPNVDTVSIGATAEDPNAKTKVLSGGKEVKGDIALKTGLNEVYVVVLAEDGTCNMYTVKINRRALSVNADLKGISLSSGSLSPAFSATRTAYEASVANSVTSVKVTPAVSDSRAKVTVNGQAAGAAVALNEGRNTITVKVTAEDGKTVKAYTITVSRLAKVGAKYKYGSMYYKVKTAANGTGTVEAAGYSGNKMTSVKIPNTIAISGITYKVTAVGTKAFYKKSKLKTVTVGDNVSTIGTSAFEKCTALKTVTLGTGVTTIGKKAFSSDTKLAALKIKSSKLKSVGSSALYKVKNVKIKAPKSKVKTYKRLFKGKKAKKYSVVKL